MEKEQNITHKSTKQQREFLGVWIPKEIYLDDDLSWKEKILLIEITSLDTEEKGCFASNKYFTEFLQVKNETYVSKMISKLKKRNLVWEEKFDGRHRILHSILKEGLEKSITQSYKKIQGRVIKNYNPENSENVDKSSQTTQKTPPNNIVNNKEYNILSAHSSPNYTSSSKQKTSSSKNPPPPKQEPWTKELLKWLEEKQGAKFANYGKQLKALGNLKKAGYTPEQIKDCYEKMMKDKFWKERLPDFMNIANNITKYIKKSKVVDKEEFIKEQLKKKI